MSYNDKKIAQVLLEHCKRVEQRCPKYRDAMQELLEEVLKLEREHAVARTNIASKIGDQINTVGMFLYRSTSPSEKPS